MEMIKIGWSMVLPLQDAFMRNRTFYWAVWLLWGFAAVKIRWEVSPAGFAVRALIQISTHNLLAFSTVQAFA